MLFLEKLKKIVQFSNFFNPKNFIFTLGIHSLISELGRVEYLTYRIRHPADKLSVVCRRPLLQRAMM